MAKITSSARQLYYEKTKNLLSAAKILLDEEKLVIIELLNVNAQDAPFKKIMLADKMLNLSSIYCVMNGISCAVLNSNNEEALGEGRKSLTKVITYLEDVVTNFIDVPFSDYEEKLVLIESFDANKRYDLIRKTGLALDLMKNAYGETSKWRWAFVDLEGRFTAIVKNFIDFRYINQNRTPGSAYYESTVYHLRLMKKLMLQTADRFRDKYELSTNSSQDFKKGLAFLSAMRRLHLILGEAEAAEELKKKFAAWKIKMDADSKKKDEAKKN